MSTTYADRPLVRYEALTPATAVRGHRLEFTDARGRRVVGLIRNAFPGYVAVSPLEVAGVSKEAVQCFHMMAVKWPGRDFYAPAEVTNRRGCDNCGAKTTLSTCWQYDHAQRPVCDDCAEEAILRAEWEQSREN